MRKFILLLMLGASALGFSQNATYNSSTSVLTLDGVEYHAVGSQAASLTADFSIADGTSSLIRSINTFYNFQYPNSVAALINSTPAAIHSGRNAEFNSGSFQIWVGATKSLVDGEFVFTQGTVTIYNWNDDSPNKGTFSPSDFQGIVETIVPTAVRPMPIGGITFLSTTNEVVYVDRPAGFDTSRPAYLAVVGGGLVKRVRISSDGIPPTTLVIYLNGYVFSSSLNYEIRQ